MPLIPIATFLAGALLTLLLPVGILITLVVWYWIFSARVPENDQGSTADGATAGMGAVPTSAHGAESALPNPGTH